MSAALRDPLSPLGFVRAFCVTVEKVTRTRLTYGLSVLLALAGNAVGFAVVILVWRRVYDQNPESALVPRESLFPYLAIAFLINYLLTLNVEIRFGSDLRRGLIVSDLLRPLGFMPFQMAHGVADVAGNLLLCFPIYALALGLLGGALLPYDLTDLALTTLSLTLAFLINFGISYLIVQAALITHSNYGIDFARASMHQAFSGLMAPLAVFPDPLRKTAEILPFRHVIETPARFWLRQVPEGQTLALLLEQLGWALGLLTVGGCLLHVTLKRHQIQGG